MFTGIVIEQGVVAEPPPRLRLRAPGVAADAAIGDSVAVDGCCLTVTEIDGVVLAFDAVPETLRRTNLGRLQPGDEVNLEPALRMGDALGGHMVQGHVDGTAEVVDRRDLEEHRVLAFSIPPELAPFLVEKGSVTVDGVSLTVSALLPDRFEVALIPHTLEMTSLARRVPGDRVNLEMDVIGKYVHRILAARGLVPPLPGESA